MQIQGLTEEQVEMLDFMWSLDSMEEFEEWKSGLDRRERLMADTLQPEFCALSRPQVGNR